MTIHIIDNKKVDLTDQEWEMYGSICISYDNPPSVRGKDLFADLFETDESGIILFLKPPRRQTSFEIFFFLMSIMEAQHLRMFAQQIKDACTRVDEKLNELKEAKSKKK